MENMDIDGLEGAVAPPRPAPHSCSLHASAEDQENTLGKGVTFQSNVLGADSLDALFKPFLGENTSNDRLVVLSSFIGCLMKTKDDSFLPKRIYIRNCMIQIFGYFRDDVLLENSGRVLLGSPGVGKSVLFFIAALYLTEKKCTMPIVYIRKTQEDRMVSVFVMSRTNAGVEVFHSRKVEKKKYKTLAYFREAAASLFGLEMRQCVVFLDGPRHDEEKDLNAYYDYFCTSGGHPLRKNAQKSLFLWVLDGWRKAESITALTAFGHTTDLASDAYSICGGCIRDMVDYVNSDDVGREETKLDLESLVDRVQDDQVELVLTHTSRNNDDDSGNPDRLRMMFNKANRSSKRTALVVQIVDSQLVLYLLRGRLGLASYFKAMQLGKTINSGTVVGVYFEEIMHAWFVELPEGITKTHKATGTGAEGVLTLVEENVYWIPSIPNFPNIDGAVVKDGVLYVFQYTKRTGHEFDEDTFWQAFVSVVRGNLSFTRIHVYVVVMKGVTSNLNVSFTRTWTELNRPTQTRSTAQRFSITCSSSTVDIDITNPETVRTSASSGLFF